MSGLAVFWVLSFLFLAAGWFNERARRVELQIKVQELCGVTLDLVRRYDALKERHQAYMEIELEDGPGAVIPNVIGDDDRPVDIRA